LLKWLGRGTEELATELLESETCYVKAMLIAVRRAYC
jgi:hypothetical protein